MNKNYFEYSSDKLNNLIKLFKTNGMKQVTMQGVYEDLQKLEPLIEDFYNKNIFHLDDWVNECCYHGWDWNEDDGTMLSMKRITTGITENFLQIYALILVGLGKTLNDKEKSIYTIEEQKNTNNKEWLMKFKPDKNGWRHGARLES